MNTFRTVWISASTLSSMYIVFAMAVRHLIRFLSMVKGTKLWIWMYCPFQVPNERSHFLDDLVLSSGITFHCTTATLSWISHLSGTRRLILDERPSKRRISSTQLLYKQRQWVTFQVFHSREPSGDPTATSSLWELILLNISISTFYWNENHLNEDYTTELTDQRGYLQKISSLLLG